MPKRSTSRPDTTESKPSAETDEVQTQLPPKLSASPSAPQRSLAAELLRLFAIAIGWTIFFVIFLFVLTGIAVGAYAYQKLQLFTDAAHLTIPQLINVAEVGWYSTVFQDHGNVNFLVLGTDHLSTRGDSTALTDTMMLASLHLHTGQVSLFSLPRDIWSEDYQTKINALYVYGQQRYPQEPERFTREVVEQLTGVKVQHTVVLTLDTLSQLIDTIGGVDITVKEGFVDTQFPRPDVDVTKVHDPKLLYMTVEFKPGVEHMSGARVLEYVRSRHSSGDQGNDTARALRQQEVIYAVINTLKNPQFYQDPARVGRLYYFYSQHFNQALSIKEAIAIGRQVLPHLKNVTLTKAEPSIYPDDPHGTITHPPTQKTQNQWAYEIRDHAVFQHEVQTKLGLSGT